jgi:hypothetical protein
MSSTRTLSLSNLCEDVILLICDHLTFVREEDQTPLKNLSLVDRHFRSLLTPRIFKALEINRPVRQLEPLSSIEHHAQTFKIDMFGSMWWWCSGSYTSSSDALELFRSIQSMDNLKTLEISMMKRSIDIYTAAFKDGRVSDDSIFILDRVANLVVTSSAAFLASHCPNLKSLVIKDGSDCLIDSYTNLTERLAPLYLQLKAGNSHLTHFDATAVWSAEELEKLVTAYPNLRSLRMRTDTYCYRASASTIIDILSEGLADLQTLHLVKSSSLGLGYQAVWKRKVAQCSDVEYRFAVWMENERRRVEAENTLVREAFGKMESLKECWLGEKRVARRCAHDRVPGQAQWKWERRREDAEECVMGGQMFAKMRIEKEVVVVESEIGY